LNTRLYFSVEGVANAADPGLNLIEWENRRKALIAERTETDGKVLYQFDIRLQGQDGTVFFDI
jgi:protocatechuate 3,4-dioxygenase alpha subunit